MNMLARRAAAALDRTAVALAAVACFGAPTAPEFPLDAPPSALELKYGGFGFGSHDVLLRGDTLVVTRITDFRPDSTRTTRVVPTRVAWADFWRAADAAGVRSWPHACSNTDIVDGGGFSLRIAYAGGRVEASGANSYPQRDGHCGGSADWTPEYSAFAAAVSRLIGGPFP
jgi:hypothetical protein